MNFNIFAKEHWSIRGTSKLFTLRELKWGVYNVFSTILGGKMSESKVCEGSTPLHPPPWKSMAYKLFWMKLLSTDILKSGNSIKNQFSFKLNRSN